MLLAIDIGNTKIKAAVFEDNALIEKFIFDREEGEKKIEKIFDEHKKITSSVLSSVGKDDNELLSRLQLLAPLYIIDRNFKFPFHNKYGTPQTLGIDRMVL